MEITSATLSNNSLTVTVSNKGNDTIKLRMVIISELVTKSEDRNRMPAVLVGSEVLVVANNGSLLAMPLRYEEHEVKKDAKALFDEKGFDLSAGSSTTLEYSGPISLEFGLPIGNMPTKFISGKQYLITVIGDEALANSVVVAH